MRETRREMRILGIDPGYAIMGYGILDYKGNKFTPVAYGSITTEAHTPNEERLMKLYDELTGIQWGTKPDPFGWTVPVTEKRS